MNQTLNLLKTRRSVKAASLAAPGPSPAELDEILTCAARVPDHKKMVPWRFVVFERPQWIEALLRRRRGQRR